MKTKTPTPRAILPQAKVGAIQVDGIGVGGLAVRGLAIGAVAAGSAAAGAVAVGALVIGRLKVSLAEAQTVGGDQLATKALQKNIRPGQRIVDTGRSMLELAHVFGVPAA